MVLLPLVSTVMTLAEWIYFFSSCSHQILKRKIAINLTALKITSFLLPVPPRASKQDASCCIEMTAVVLLLTHLLVHDVIVWGVWP